MLETAWQGCTYSQGEICRPQRSDFPCAAQTSHLDLTRPTTVVTSHRPKMALLHYGCTALPPSAAPTLAGKAHLEHLLHRVHDLLVPQHVPQPVAAHDDGSVLHDHVHPAHLSIGRHPLVWLLVIRVAKGPAGTGVAGCPMRCSEACMHREGKWAVTQCPRGLQAGT